MKQYFGNVYEISPDVVSVLVLHKDDVSEYATEYFDTESLARIARTMADALLGDAWEEALRQAIDIELVERENHE